MNLRRKRSGPLDLQFTVVNGAAANANIAVTGIKRGDGLLAVLREAAGVLTSDLVAQANITSDGNIQLTTQVTTGEKLLVIWSKR
jgi:hypothetical protein